MIFGVLIFIGLMTLLGGVQPKFFFWGIGVGALYLFILQAIPKVPILRALDDQIRNIPPNRKRGYVWAFVAVLVVLWVAYMRRMSGS